MTFAITHHLSSAALTDLLTLINLHCLIDIPSLQSLYRFQNYFNYKDSPLKYHYYCPRCLLSLESGNVTQCPNNACMQVFNTACSPSYFLEIPIAQQIQNMFARKGFYNDLQYRFQRRKNNLMHIEDIFDGNVYKDHMKPSGFFVIP